MLRTPSGTPACWANFASRIVAPGSLSDGFRMTVFPQAMANGNTHYNKL